MYASGGSFSSIRVRSQTEGLQGRALGIGEEEFTVVKGGHNSGGITQIFLSPVTPLQHLKSVGGGRQWGGREGEAEKPAIAQGIS